MESDLWLYGLADLLAKSGCLERGCAVLMKGAIGDPERPDRLIVTHELTERMVAGERIEVMLDVIRALGRRDQLGITGRAVRALKECHGEAR